MKNKSFIQEQLEYIQTKSLLEKDINNILENYDVQDSVMSIVCGKTTELTSGYFIESKRFDNLSEAIRELNVGQSIRIVDNKEFIVGDVYESLHDCPEESEHVFNIEFLEDVY